MVDIVTGTYTSRLGSNIGWDVSQHCLKPNLQTGNNSQLPSKLYTHFTIFDSSENYANSYHCLPTTLNLYVPHQVNLLTTKTVYPLTFCLPSFIHPTAPCVWPCQAICYIHASMSGWNLQFSYHAYSLSMATIC